MELSAEMLKSMLSGIKTEAKGFAEMRRAPRVAVRYTVKIVPYTNGTLGQPIRVWTRDISAGGIGLLHATEMEAGSKFIIQLPREGGKPLLLLCTVRNCQEVSDSLYAIGASFAEVAGGTAAVQEAEGRLAAPAALAAKPAPVAVSKPAPRPAPAHAPLQPAADAPDPARLLTEEVERISRAILS